MCLSRQVAPPRRTASAREPLVTLALSYRHPSLLFKTWATLPTPWGCRTLHTLVRGNPEIIPFGIGSEFAQTVPMVTIAFSRHARMPRRAAQTRHASMPAKLGDENLIGTAGLAHRIRGTDLGWPADRSRTQHIGWRFVAAVFSYIQTQTDSEEWRKRPQ